MSSGIATPACPAAPQRVLVTGGSGFIGSHLSGRLRAEGQDVLVADHIFQADQPTCPASSPVQYHPGPVRTTKTKTCVCGFIGMLGQAKLVGARLIAELRSATPFCLRWNGI